MNLYHNRRKAYRRFLIALLVLLLAGSIGMLYHYYDEKIPDSMHISSTDAASGTLSMPTFASFWTEAEEVTVTSDSIVSSVPGTYEIRVKLLGIVPLKTVEVSVSERPVVYLGGDPIGLYLETSGVMVVGTGEVTDADGTVWDPAANLVEAGDYIVKLNDVPVKSKDQLVYLIRKYGGSPIRLEISDGDTSDSGSGADGDTGDSGSSNGVDAGDGGSGDGSNADSGSTGTREITIQPVKDADGEYKLGLWVRDDTQGIGTLTFITREGAYGALGHGISDVDTGELFSARGGTLYIANIWGIIRGIPGTPGGLCGMIYYEEKNELGTILKNTATGIYGNANETMLAEYAGEAIEIGYKQEVAVGAASVYVNLEGEAKAYDINIIGVNYAADNDYKGLIIEVTDEELLELTGGIIQGMSGSPIIQNGRLIGAVTHVFVQDATKGYGIFIEDMLEELTLRNGD